MSLNHSPSITTNNLLLNLDFNNPKKFTDTFGPGNLVQNPTYATNLYNNGWVSYFPANTSLRTGIDAPDGTKTAIRLTCKTTGSSLLRVWFNNFTPNGTDTYTASFFVRKISGTTSSQLLSSDVNDAGGTSYTSQLITDKWVRIVYSWVPTNTVQGFIDLLSDNTNDYVLDFWGVRIENSTTTNSGFPLKDTISNTIFNLYRPAYYSLNSDNITFTRTASTPKHGATALAVPTGNLTLANFLYNNHTWEIWFKIDDKSPGSYDANEFASILAVYPGYHQGFFYTGSTMYYNIWDNTGGTAVERTCCSWSLGTTGAQINQGSWYQIAVTRSGNVFTPYRNGVQFGTSYTITSLAFNNLYNSGTLQLGAATNYAAGAGNYNYYAKNTIANMKMYNRALSASEIKQNFNALRGRSGL